MAFFQRIHSADGCWINLAIPSIPSNTTCLPRPLDATSGLFMSVDTTPYYAVSVYDGPSSDANNISIYHVYGLGGMGVVGLVAAVVGLVYYLRPVSVSLSFSRILGLLRLTSPLLRDVLIVQRMRRRMPL